MKLRVLFADALEEMERGRHFLPFVGGEPARLELCALAAKRCFGVPVGAAIDPWEAADNVGIIVSGDAFFDQLDEDERRQILEDGASQWSAGTLLGPDCAMIVLNPTHDPVRQKATLAEELAHIAIGHPPSRLDPSTGLRTYHSDVESEAYAVGAAMILPYQHLFNAVKRGVLESALASRFGVSTRFVIARINRAGLRPMYRKRVGALRG
jgi:hypothetical protein